jgi:predicted enzyme related to lactoylglutathione lyase
MSQTPPKVGTIGWTDLTVPDAVAVSDFYAKVAGWTATPMSMGDYDDFVMMTPGGEAVGGVCHARGRNAALPPVWMVYITVADLDASLAACTAGGGRIVAEPRSGGETARYAIIADPAGATVALFDPGVREQA